MNVNQGQSDQQVFQLLTTRIDQEIFIRKQQQDRLAIEKYYMTLEDAFAKSRRKIEVEQQFSEM